MCGVMFFVAGYVACCQFSLVDRDELDGFDG